MQLYYNFILFALSIIPLHVCTKSHDKDSRIYTSGLQFPLDSQHLQLPNIVALSIHMGKVKYRHMRLTLESMKWNPGVKFVLINIVDNTDRGTGDASELIKLAEAYNVINFYVEILSYGEFADRVEQKLGIRVSFNSSWFYKMTDYKPTLALLFPEVIDGDPRGLKFSYWGYVDLDLVWGNFSRFAHLFQGDYAVITSDFQGASGVAMFFKNEAWTRTIFQSDPLFTLLLKNHTDYQLDEFSRKGIYESTTMDQQISRLLPKRGFGEKSNRGRHWKEKLWVEEEGSINWAGPVRWFRGTLQIVKGSPEFPPGHEVLIFHRPEKNYDLALEFPQRVVTEIEDDMVTYGYLLPNWVPLLTRHMCGPNDAAATWWQPTTKAMDNYRPYALSCFAEHAHEHANEHHNGGAGAEKGTRVHSRRAKKDHAN